MPIYEDSYPLRSIIISTLNVECHRFILKYIASIILTNVNCLAGTLNVAVLKHVTLVQYEIIALHTFLMISFLLFRFTAYFNLYPIC